MAAWSGEPSIWGRDDCMLAVANIDLIVLGTDTAKGWRGRYRSAAGAKRIMGKRGVLGTALRVAKAMGWRSIDPAAAQDGDRGIGATPGGVTCLIRYRGFWVGRADRGNWLISDREMIKAWRII